MAHRVLKDYEKVSLTVEDGSGELDLGEIFGRKGPVHVEIGSGKGTFILSQARENPEVDFLGIEWARKYYRFSVDRIGRWGLDNVRIIRADAAYFIGRHLPESSVEWFGIYFPDPWPKKRHHKRRFLCGANMEQLLRCLKVGGVINIVTDHAGYFEQITEVIEAEIGAGRVERTDFVRGAGAAEGELTGTNYERKYLVEGRQRYTAAVRKV
jgi:tRNA (guanine-N7-)-methyltransferase